MALYLLKIGELYLKGDNQRMFVRALQRNLARMLAGTGAVIRTRNGRFFVDCTPEADGAVKDALGRLFGITGWALARLSPKTPAAVVAACLAEAETAWQRGARSFRILARRSDKRFPLNSQEICVKAGGAVAAAFPEFRVKMTGADVEIQVEIRENAYIYGAVNAGLRGLPVGTAGRGMLLLSGGIDSPVAGYLMAGRGLSLDAVYFHAPPYTGEEALQKVETLAEILGRYTMGVKLHVISFTGVEQRIKERAPVEWRTVLLRMAMMETAEKRARQRKCGCLITGESLSQVASQTVSNIACTESTVTLPVLRPLIGMDKEAITRLSIKIGAYETSILPYADCCTLFSPAHPVINGAVAEAQRLYRALELETLPEEK
jgi:thiamine biosynthesis protein ThiI